MLLERKGTADVTELQDSRLRPGLLGGQKGAGNGVGHAGLHVSHQVASPARNRKGGKGTLKMVGKQGPAGIYHDWEVPVFGILINFNTLKYLISDLFLA